MVTGEVKKEAFENLEKCTITSNLVGQKRFFHQTEFENRDVSELITKQQQRRQQLKLLERQEQTEQHMKRFDIPLSFVELIGFRRLRKILNLI